MLCGHTHTPRIARVVHDEGHDSTGATLVVNPGSVGVPAYDDDHPHEHRVETGSPHARWALIERDAGGWVFRSDRQWADMPRLHPPGL